MKAVFGIILGMAVTVSTAAVAETTVLGSVDALEWQPAFDAPAADVKPAASSTEIFELPEKTSPFAGIGGGAWSARLQYTETVDRPDLIGANVANGATSRPGFAVLQHSFGRGEFRPYVGVGIGAADTQFSERGHLEEDGFAVMGVVGSNLQFTDKVGGFMQYEHAVATNAIVGVQGETKSHGLSFGVKIMLN